MEKKISSEVSFNKDNLKYKIGTINKKNPETVYLEIGSYIEPLDSEKWFDEDFTSAINTIRTKSKKALDKILFDLPEYNKNSIIVTDIADERLLCGKKSYMEIQVYVKPKKDLIGKSNGHFKLVANYTNEKIGVPLIDEIFSLLTKNGFSYSKTKNK